ncbi:MAG: FimV/HubP family polar landmark protein [Pseudomonadota bacterium]|nr:FimV/HubP family polar landmark protein [Pseudomonadota bacterium]
MFRKLILASAVSLVLLPDVAGALGLGGIRAQSALNEPFAGEIDLLDVKLDQLDTVKAVLAAESEFRKAGAERPHFLSTLRFKAQVSPRGQPVIRVTSPHPIREPYLDFLVEVNWPKGRLVKEYTVLLDPPVTLNRLPPRVERPAVARAPTRPASASKPRAATASVKPSITGGAAGFPLRYGPVPPGAGLWRVARSLAPSGATVAQTAMALYRNNQHAFIRGDINKLKLDAVLGVPSSAELFALDTTAAEREFQAALRGERVTSAPLTDVSADQVPANRLKIAGPATPVPETLPETPAQAGSEAEPELGAIKDELLLVQEAGESTRQETGELRDRIRQLETQLADIRRLLELRDEQLAALQAARDTQAAEMPDAAAIDASPVGSASDSLSGMDGSEPSGSEDARAAGAGESVEQDANIVMEADERDEGAKTLGTADGPSAEGEPSAPQPEENREEKGERQLEAASSYWGSLSTPSQAVVVGLPVLLLLVAWAVVSRRRRREQPEESEERLIPAQPSGPTVGTLGGGPLASTTEKPYGEPQPPVGDGGLGGLEGDAQASDIVAEADVYLAYSRFRDAESLLREAIAKSPKRMDLRYKLAEALFGAEDREALAALMDEIQQGGDDRADTDQWQRLTSMMRDLEGHATIPVEDLGLPGGRETPSKEEPQETEGAPSDLELDLDDLEDLDLENFGQPATQSADLQTPAAADPMEKLLQEIGAVPSPATGGADSPDVAMTDTVSAAGELLSPQWEAESDLWDEVATKIDLARAYMEMEDSEAARVILEEVLEEGNEAQRAEAQASLEKLS